LRSILRKIHSILVAIVRLKFGFDPFRAPKAASNAPKEAFFSSKEASKKPPAALKNPVRGSKKKNVESKKNRGALAKTNL